MAQDQTLADLSRDLLLLGATIANGTAELPDAGALRQQVLSMFEGFKAMATRRGCLPAEIEASQYALSAFMDEAILYSGWQDKQTWSSQPLQAQFFGEALAGVNFFERLAQLRRQSPDATEVYYLCILLGFKGQYRDPRLEPQLAGLLNDLRRELVRGKLRRLSPHGDPPDEAVGEGKHFPFLPVTGAALLVAVLVVALFFILLMVGRGDAVDLLMKLAKGT